MKYKVVKRDILSLSFGNLASKYKLLEVLDVVDLETLFLMKDGDLVYSPTMDINAKHNIYFPLHYFEEVYDVTGERIHALDWYSVNAKKALRNKYVSNTIHRYITAENDSEAFDIAIRMLELMHNTGYDRPSPLPKLKKVDYVGERFRVDLLGPNEPKVLLKEILSK